MPSSVQDATQSLLKAYTSGTDARTKIIDIYLLYILLSGAAQFAYCGLVGTFPFNSFLAGFISCVGSFVLTVCLRLQVSNKNKDKFAGISEERAFADFLFCSIVLHFVVMNFLG